jgi:hypothetical protein
MHVVDAVLWLQPAASDQQLHSSILHVRYYKQKSNAANKLHSGSLLVAVR